MHLTKELKKEISKFGTEGFVVLDTATTGLDFMEDEVIAVTIADSSGNTLFHKLIRPNVKRSWPDATAVNGITWDDVKDERPLVDYADEITEILNSASLVVGYNLTFHLKMMSISGLTFVPGPYFDLMQMYASVHGEWSEWKHDYQWASLKDVARHYGVMYDKRSKTNDAMVTAKCYRLFVEECRNAKPEGRRNEREKPRSGKATTLLVIVLVLSLLTAFTTFGTENTTAFYASVALSVIMIVVLAFRFRK